MDFGSGPKPAELSAEVWRWLGRRTGRVDQWPARRVLRAKGRTRVSVVLPARNEQETVGCIVSEIRHRLMEEIALVDEIVVVDSRSEDATAAVASAAGALVVHQDAILSELVPMDGKGDALWKGLAASTGDVVVFVDSDLRDFTAAFVIGLLGPLLCEPDVQFAKGFYMRPLVSAGTVTPGGGGRVSELVARPLINLYWPRLAGFIQPLAGEYGGRRELLERIPFVTGYGVELAMLIDLLEEVGLDALAQVDLGTRVHRHHDVEALGRMAGQILLAATARLQRQGVLCPTARPSTVLTQFRHDGTPGGHHRLVVSDIDVQERPPLACVRSAIPAADGAGITPSIAREPS